MLLLERIKAALKKTGAKDDCVLRAVYDAEGGEGSPLAWATKHLFGGKEDTTRGFIMAWTFPDAMFPPSNAREFADGWYEARKIWRDLNVTPKVTG